MVLEDLDVVGDGGSQASHSSGFFRFRPLLVQSTVASTFTSTTAKSPNVPNDQILAEGFPHIVQFGVNARLGKFRLGVDTLSASQ